MGNWTNYQSNVAFSVLFLLPLFFVSVANESKRRNWKCFVCVCYKVFVHWRRGPNEKYCAWCECYCNSVISHQFSTWCFGILPKNILRQLTRLMDETNNLPGFMQIQHCAHPKKNVHSKSLSIIFACTNLDWLCGQRFFRRVVCCTEIGWHQT